MTALGLPDVLSVALRAVSYVLLLQAAGIALFLALWGRKLSISADAVRRLALVSAVLGLATLIAQFALEAARMAGDLTGLWDLSLQKTAFHSGQGEALGVRVLSLLLIAVALRRRSDIAVVTNVIGATLAVTSFLFMGHTSVHPQRAVLGPILAVHLLIVAFWFGALPALYLASRREAPARTAEVINEFSARAVWLVPFIFLTGLGTACLLVPRWSVFGQPYGELLMVKVGGFATLMGFAALNKWRLGPAVATGDDRALRTFRASLAAEYVLIAGVITATTAMTTFFSPE
jgi:copper resistance protein D